MIEALRDTDLKEFKVFLDAAKLKDNPWLNFTNDVVFRVACHYLSAYVAISQEVQRLRDGNFTQEELQNLCHNLSDKDYEAFCNGCDEYQKKLFGKCRTQDRTITVESGSGRHEKPPYANCPFPGCTAKPRLNVSGKWWECGSGQPHFMWDV